MRTPELWPMKSGLALAFVLMLAVIHVAASVFVSSRRGLWDPDEPRYAEVAREMRAAGEWVVPQLNGEVYTAKPPLFFWLAGDSPVGARLPSVIAGAVVLIATGVLGLRLFGPRGAVAASLALLAIGQFEWQSATAQLDQLLSAFETAGLACLVVAAFPPKEEGKEAEERRPARPLAAIGFALLGIGVLAKGPVSFLVPLLALGAFFGIGKTRPRYGWGWLGLPIGLVPAAAWFATASARAGTSYAQKIGFTETVVRYFAGESHRMSAPELWGHFLVGLLPLGVFVLPAIVEAVRAERHALAYGAGLVDRLPTLLPLCWIATSVVFFSFSSGKRGVYLVPTYPAVALLLAWYVDRPRGSKTNVVVKIERALAVVFAALGVLLVPAAIVATKYWVPWSDFELEPVTPWIEAAVVGALLLVAAAATWKDKGILAVLALATTVTLVAVSVRVVPHVDVAKSAERASRKLMETMPAEAEWCSLGEPLEGLLYYSQKKCTRFPMNDEGVELARRWLSEKPAKRWVVWKQVNADSETGKKLRVREVVRARSGRDFLVLSR